MQKIFLAYANARDEQPLPTLHSEEEQVYRVLARREAERHFSLHRDIYATIPRIAEYLCLYQDQIIIFHYSGHADTDVLLLADEAANAAGIAGLLARCPQLKLVVLNGCSTGEQVDQLLQAGLPAVIATSAPVGDHAAAQFAITFYQSLAERQASLKEAFEDAIAAAQLHTEQPLLEKVERAGRLAAHNNSSAGSWGLYYRDEHILSWKLPLATQLAAGEYTPNQRLIEQLMEALAPYDADIRRMKDQEELGVERSLGEKKKAILRCLPHPISQQLRKLMSKEKGLEDHVFYDKPGPDRLWQIGHTYATMVELLAFILLADLWRGVEQRQQASTGQSLELKGELSNLQEFLVRPAGGENPYDYISLIRNLRLLIEENGFSFFMEEFKGISRIFNEETPFAAACRFLEVLRRRKKGSYEQEEAVQLCAMAEDKLAVVFSELGFLAAYSLLSVRDIYVLKFRYPVDVMFNHRVIRLDQEFFELEEVPEVLNAFMDTSSVLLQRKQGGEFSYLSLSPFVIDESAFDRKAELAKLLFFERYEKSSDMQRYRHVYKPTDAPVMISSDQKHFKPLRVQFEAFSRSLFHQNLKNL